MSHRRDVTVVAVAALRDHIARALLPTPNEESEPLGAVSLRPHQHAGAARLQELLRRYRGALLADEVGLGKTYTALAVARRFGRVEIVGPAALRAMWHEACARCDVAADYVTAESLSRARAPASGADLVIVDEAHWFRSPATKRYRQLALRCRRAVVLLLSATPLHNRPGDVSTLLALFLGRRAQRLTPHAIAQLTVRRGRATIPAERQPPPVAATRWWRVPIDARLVGAIDAIEPPVPLRDGGVAMALLRLTLHRRLASSHAALRTTLRGMLGRALAMREALRAGRRPSERQLRAWLTSDEAIQLVLPGLAFDGAEPNELLETGTVERHIGSLRAAIAALGAADADRRRAVAIVRVMRRFPNARIVAFSQYDATVRALGRALHPLPGVAVLSGKGGRIASGRLPRSEILKQFDATHRDTPVVRSMQMRLLLTTDLLSEGVNLHNANVVVHLDLPWTAARLEQRVGRVSRLGSPHDVVHVFGFAPPASVARLQRTMARLRAKWRTARRRFGDTPVLARESLVVGAGATDSKSVSDAQEALLARLRDWLGTGAAHSVHERRHLLVAYATGTECAPTLALLARAADARLVAVMGSRVSAHPRALLRVANDLTTASDACADGALLAIVRAQIGRYLARERAALGVAQVSSTLVPRFLRAAARAVAAIPRQQRPRGVALEGELRSMLLAPRSAGDVQLLDEQCALLVQRVAASAPLSWLESAHAALQRSMGHGGARADWDREWHIAAILIGT